MDHFKKAVLVFLKDSQLAFVHEIVQQPVETAASRREPVETGSWYFLTRQWR